MAISSAQLDFEEMQVLEGITNWMQVNSEGIYSTRPWKICGEDPSTQTKLESGSFNENKQGDLTASDVRFNTKGSTLYAFVMGRPQDEAAVQSLGLNSPQHPGKVGKVELLGYDGTLQWKQEDASLRVQMPGKLADAKPSQIGITLKVQMA